MWKVRLGRADADVDEVTQTSKGASDLVTALEKEIKREGVVKADKIQRVKMDTCAFFHRRKLRQLSTRL